MNKDRHVAPFFAICLSSFPRTSFRAVGWSVGVGGGLSFRVLGLYFGGVG